MGTAIDVKNVTILRDGERIIDDASFTVEKGGYVGMVGPNGGGKTSIINGILGLVPTETGEIRLFDVPLREFKEWHRVGYVAQDATDFDPNFPMSVRELVALGRVRRQTMGRPLTSQDWEAVDRALDLMDITDIQHRRVGHLSGGQKQRVFVAKSIVHRPDLLILDEPVTGVDLGTQEEFYGLLYRVNRERGTSILMISHDLATVFCQMSDVVCVNRQVHTAPITPELDQGALLRKVYGDHFTFVFHEHQCEFNHHAGGSDID
jgi:zinc transport system ATP-binding protein